MRLRAPTPGDAPAVLEVLVARDIADLGAPDYTLEDLHDEWRGSDFDLASDAVVVETDDRQIAGYAILRRPGTLAVVAPEHEGRGIGSLVLGWTENRDRQLGRNRHRQWVPASNGRARELLVAAGYALERSYWRMVRVLDQVPAPAAAPEGFELRVFDVEADAAAVHALDIAAFSANADYEPESLEHFREEHLEAHDLDPALSLVARAGERYAGYLLARRWSHDRVGFIDILAVHPDHQRRGLAGCLLATAFHRFAAAGLREAQLGVASDNPRALRLYERAGMTPRFQIDTYGRPTRQR
jgi:mycothiol synthase